MRTSKVKITEEEYNKYVNSSREELKDFFVNIAINSGWHPAGYGMYSYELKEENGEFFAVWEHWHSCD